MLVGLLARAIGLTQPRGMSMTPAVHLMRRSMRRSLCHMCPPTSTRAMASRQSAGEKRFRFAFVARPPAVVHIATYIENGSVA